VVQTAELPERALLRASRSQGCGHDQSDIFATQKTQKSRRIHCQALEDEFLNYLQRKRKGKYSEEVSKNECRIRGRITDPTLSSFVCVSDRSVLL